MDYQQIMLIGLIATNAIVSIIGCFTGNKDLTAKAIQQQTKTMNKLKKKHEKTQQMFIEEEKQIERTQKQIEKLER